MKADKYSENKKLFSRIEKYASLVSSIYDTANKEAVKILQSTSYDGASPFLWDDYPSTSKKIKSLISDLQKSIEVTIVNSITEEWKNSEAFNESLARETMEVYGVPVKEIKNYTRYFGHNKDALKAFINRVENKNTLSSRVWNITNQYKGNLELIFSILGESMANGESAASMSKKVRKYLNEPDRLYRRVRNIHGDLVLSKNARKYSPTTGQYRSSYKNAMRLCRTETNMAYRSSDYEKMQTFDFVVGIEVKLSNNHTLNGVPFSDICDTLKGKYPKDFKFTGWHPQCRCYTIAVLMTDEEFFSEGSDSINVVKKPPEGFNKWLSDNSTRIAKAKKKGTTPYFLRDNKKYI